MIVGSASPDDVHSLDHFDMYRNNESVTPNPRSPLEDYTLHVVDMEMGRLCDSRTFRHDKIYLSHNQGLYLYRHTLAVLSVQHQTIYIFQVMWWQATVIYYGQQHQCFFHPCSFTFVFVMTVLYSDASQRLSCHLYLNVDHVICIQEKNRRSQDICHFVTDSMNIVLEKCVNMSISLKSKFCR